MPPLFEGQGSVGCQVNSWIAFQNPGPLHMGKGKKQKRDTAKAIELAAAEVNDSFHACADTKDILFGWGAT